MLLSLLSKRTLRADFRIELARDAYGFTVRPQYLEAFKEFDAIYRNEEEERATKWECFLEEHEELNRLNSVVEENVTKTDAEVTEIKTDPVLESSGEADDPVLESSGEADVLGDTNPTTDPVPESSGEADVLSDNNPTTDPVLESSGEADVSSDNNPTNDNQTESVPEKVVSPKTPKTPRTPNTPRTPRTPKTPKPKKPAVRNWADVRSSLTTIENIMCHRVKNRPDPNSSPQKHMQSIKEEEEPSNEDTNKELTDTEEPYSFPLKELESLVRGGVPRDLRGEVWQAFVGVKARRVESYYQDLLDESELAEKAIVPEKTKKQIEKDLPRTFPGHPALDEEGRNSLRRLLLAYARHNPSVGYCQAMNFFAAMLLLMMPEENAFWTLVGMIDDYFDGYFTTDMIESQVDQLVFEDLMRERYPNLVNHFDLMGVEMGWICGPWFLSIFVNIIPWESVLRVWDVILFEGNRAMLLRTALALMELYGPDLGTTLDAGDAITLLQSLVGSTFDSSNLVVTACISFSNVTEDILQNLRNKHRPDVVAAVQERIKGQHARKSSKQLATKLYSFKHERDPPMRELSIKKGKTDKNVDKDILDLMSPLKRDGPNNPLATDADSLPDLQDQVIWLKAQLCSMLEDKRSATIRDGNVTQIDPSISPWVEIATSSLMLSTVRKSVADLVLIVDGPLTSYLWPFRAEELETALMEMAQQDNRRELSARIEYMEEEVLDLQQILADKKEQEKAMLEVLMRVEQEQKVTEDARISAERDAAAQRYLAGVLEEKYEQAISSLAQMEKRAVMAESMLEATLQYNSGQVKAQVPPGTIRPESIKDNNTNAHTRKTGLLSFGLGWRDKNKGKQPNEASDANSSYQEPEK
ncbi:TBC1 domain family member 8B-like protein isoform X2 [Tanacetum coccineum]